jgi:peptide/nickel transport system permease protein
MLVFFVRRIVANILVLAMILVIVSLLLRIGPDPVKIIQALSVTPLTAATKAAWRHELGVDVSVWQQMLLYVEHLAHGDMGMTFATKQPVASLIFGRLPATLELTFVAVVVGLLIAVPLGVVAALRRDRLADYAGSVTALFGFATPSFLLGVLLIYLFSIRLGWLPSFGHGVSLWRAIADGSPHELFSSLRFVIMPALALAIPLGAVNARMIRSAMLESLRQDFVRFARAKGLPNRVVTYYALRHALIPVVTELELELGGLLGGALIVENVFAWPGIGQIAVDASTSKDFPLIQGFVLVTAALFLTVNLVVDMLYALIDPRIRPS